MFLDVSEQVFILVHDVWMRFRENRSLLQSRVDLVYMVCVALQIDFGGAMLKSKIRYSGSQIEIFIMKSVPEDQCE